MRKPPFGTAENPTQFDFGKNWSLIRPYLDRPLVQEALNKGMRDFVEMENSIAESHGCEPRLNWKPGDCPQQLGEYADEFGLPKHQSLDWYRPIALCHWIAPFV